MQNTLEKETDLKRLPEKLVSDIKPLCDLLLKREPDNIEIRAAAATLHSFYSGVEAICKLIAKHIDNTSFTSEQWHINLLNSMKEVNINRPAVISQALFDELRQYLAFRHRFRNLYTFKLDWSLMSNLFINLPASFNKFKGEIKAFIE